MKAKTLLALCLAVLTGCAGNEQPNGGSAGDSIASAVADPSRSAEAVERDPSRRPGAVMTFAGVRPGQTIVEIAPAGGYYTALLSRVVGDQGHVYAVDPERIFAFFPQGREGFPAYIKQDPRNNVTYSSQNLDQIDVPNGIDQVWMVLYYHDTLWTGEDRAAMNQRFFDVLKPGGVYLVVDHQGESGADAEVAQTLHRMDPDIAMREILAAGFALDQQSDLLSNPEDPLNDSVFGPNRRGKTSRFVWRFVKPK